MLYCVVLIYCYCFNCFVMFCHVCSHVSYACVCVCVSWFCCVFAMFCYVWTKQQKTQCFCMCLLSRLLCFTCFCCVLPCFALYLLIVQGLKVKHSKFTIVLLYVLLLFLLYPFCGLIGNHSKTQVLLCFGRLMYCCECPCCISELLSAEFAQPL